MNKTLLGYIASMFTAMFMTGCTQDETIPSYIFEDGVEIRISRTSSLEFENSLTSLDGYLYAPSGKLTESYQNIQINEGECRLKMAYVEGSQLMLLANGNGLQTEAGFNTIDEQKEAVYTYNPEDGMPHMFMTGQMRMSNGMTDASVTLVRGLARIDLKLHDQDMKVSGLSISGLADRMFVWNNGTVSTPENTDTYELSISNEFSSSAEGIAYVLEQNSEVGAHIISINIEEGNYRYELKGELPKTLERNKIYAVNVYGMGQGGRINIETSLWDEGENSEASENISPIIDVEHSHIGNGVSYNSEKNELRIEFSGTEDTSLRLNVPEGYTPMIDGISDEVELINGEKGYALNINSRKRFLGNPQDVVLIKMISPERVQEASEFLKIIFETTPVKLTGNISFDETRTYDFNRYVDGELGRLVLPEGWTADVEIDDGAKWIKLDAETLNGVTRIVAGWRPNDPEADGSDQEAKIVLTDTSSGFTDTYTVIRQNWSLPVININGTWWCKYNLRGNVKDFEDQISVAEDAVIKEKGDFATYLSTCTGDEFLRLAGDQYVGGKTEGLKPTQDEEGKLFFEGYNPSGAIDFGSMPATQMAPDGYQIPTYDDYRFFTWGTNSNMGYSSNVFNNGMNGTWYARLRYEMKYRQLETENLNYGDVTIYKFWRESNSSEEWVLFGLGHQWQTGAGNISPMYILFAICDRTGNTWGMEGYTKANGSGNWYKYAAHNSGKTRMIRCIKTPVEYIY